MLLRGQPLATCAKWVVLEADKTESKDAEDRGAVVTKKSKKSTDVDTDKKQRKKTRHKLCGRSLKTNKVAST